MLDTNLLPSLFTYDVPTYPFVDVVAKHFGLNRYSLQSLHEKMDYNRLMPPGQDSQTSVHKWFYQIGDEFYEVYRRFIRKAIVGAVGHSDFIYQRIPSFRIHAPGNVAVGEFHKDGDYGHPDGEINFLVPLTLMAQTNSIYLESKPGLADFRSYVMTYGEMLAFDGRNCTHGNRVNREGTSRVSFDFRILPLSHYKPDDSAAKSVQMGTPFTIGHYYEEL
jgi:hypothetical protein